MLQSCDLDYQYVREASGTAAGGWSRNLVLPGLRKSGAEREPLPRVSLLGQVGADVNYIIGDHAESDPAPDAVRSFVE